MRVLLRGAALGGLVFGGLAVLVAVRLVERPLCGARRPVTAAIPQGVCKATLAILRLDRSVEGNPMQVPGALVANHVSWLDIFALNAAARIQFVAKSEVAGWAGIGGVARATGTLFIDRAANRVCEATARVARRLSAGHRLLFFPEGTSTDGRQVLPFRTPLFAPFLTPERAGMLWLQPVTVIYRAPPGADPRFYGWWGGMAFGPHLRSVLAARRQGEVRVVFHPPVRASAYADRKTLAKTLENRVRAALPAGA